MQGEEDICSYLKSNFEHKNRDIYLESIRQTISTQQAELTDIEPMLEEYASQYRDFIHNFNFTTHNKANALIEEALNNVHPGLKTKKQCKVVLSIVAKVFCQELIEECVQVKEDFRMRLVNGIINKEEEIGVETLGNEKQLVEIDTDIVEQAYRRRLMKKEEI